MSGALGTWIVILWAIAQSFSVARADAFTEKMSEYYGIPLRYELHYFGNDWLGATVYNTQAGRCSSQVYLSVDFRDTALGDDDLWKGVLAHEWAHVYQGDRCADNEHEADEIALRMLLEAGEVSAYFRWARFLQERWGWTVQEVYDALQHGQMGEGFHGSSVRDGNSHVPHDSICDSARCYKRHEPS